MSTIKLEALDRWLRMYLAIDSVSDISQNGLQVGDGGWNIFKVAFAVDACLDTFQLAVAQKADMLFVHHGIFWGKPFPIVANNYTRLDVLMSHRMALYAVHLPLDMHQEVGHNYTMAHRLNMQELAPFGEYHGIKIGVKGILPEPLSVDMIRDTLGFSKEETHVFGNAKHPIRSVAIVSGGSADEVGDAIAEGVDLYITGESKHEIFHVCKEAGLHVLFGGHYNTEVFGLKALAKKIENVWGLQTCFLDVPTGL